MEKARDVGPNMTTYPFEAPFDEVRKDPERYVDAVFSCLESEFLVMPKGIGFVEYPVFERGYEALKAATKGFSQLDPVKVLSVTLVEPISIVVLRTMLGFTPPEWGYVTTQRSGVSVTQGFVRSLDRKVRKGPEIPLTTDGIAMDGLRPWWKLLVKCSSEGVPPVEEGQLHRLNKADTKWIGKHQEPRRHGCSLCHALV